MIIGSIILVFDMIYITPRFEAAYHGLQYSLLSNDPFDFTSPNPIRYRILPSLLGYLSFLRGDLFFIIPLIFALLLVSSIYWVYRKKEFSPVDSVLFTGLIAFSCTIYIQLVAPGYTDAVFYFFIFLSFSFVRNLYLSACFFCLALLTHESSLFMLPGLLLYAMYINGSSAVTFIKYIAAYIIALVPLLLYRYWVNQHIAVEFDLDLYFSEKNIDFAVSKMLPLLPAGLFYAFKLFWIFPLYALYISWKNKEYNFILLLMSIIVCNVLQVIIAFDITRMLCLGFPAILLGAEKVKSYWSKGKFTRFTMSLTAINFLVFQYVINSSGIDPLLPLPYTYIIGFFTGN
ncbi:MAG: hypothetical protein H0X46_09405 [Bacteroidetes bacterium]|nr:hypothetical protein [Bacteroidota bacterium]